MKITDAQMRELIVTKDEALPKWNYTLRNAEFLQGEADLEMAAK